MKIKKHFFFLFSAALLFAACESDRDSLVNDRLNDNPLPGPITGSPGSANFSKYVAIGNSLTAGFMDAALYNAGQQNSLAALLANQFVFAGAPEEFNQPDINSVNGFNTAVPNPQNGTILGRFVLDTSIPGPVPTIGDPIGAFTGNKANLNNFGVPGILLGQLLTPATGGPADPGNPAFNPFYARFASSPGSSTILGDAITAQPTFFTLWIGNNDVLGYALSGASNEAIFTSAAAFDGQYNALMGQLMGNTNANGVIITIPPVLAIPFFRAVPFNPIGLNQAQADQLNAGYAAYNNGLAQARIGGFISEAEEQRRRINFVAGQNRYVLEDEDLTDLSALGLPNWRQSEATDLTLLTAAQAFPTGVGTQTAAPDNLVLTPEEQLAISQRAIAFNTTIAIAAANNSSRVALYDVNSGFPGNPNTTLGVFADLFGVDGSLGIVIGGQRLQPDFSPNGVFSTDGVHPNQRGNAIIANEIIKVIEAKFGSSIPKVDVLNLPSVTLAQ